MDILTHAVVGAATGAVFGYPIESAIMAVLPDVWLGFKRKDKPTKLYDAGHCLLGVVVAGAICAYYVNPTYGLCMALAVLSHIALDLPTHGADWAPPLLHPFNKRRFSLLGAEWEWFNPTWWCGLWVAFIWIVICQFLTDL